VTLTPIWIPEYRAKEDPQMVMKPPPALPLAKDATKLSKIGARPGPINVGRASPTTPAPSDASQGPKMSATTYFTRVTPTGDAPVLYNADRLWARVRLTLETAGPVVVGFSSNLVPVLSGKGVLLRTGEETVFDVSRGNRLYIAATGVNRVSVVIESVPWLEQIAGLAKKLVDYFTEKP
jgi:hypothetical protein